MAQEGSSSWSLTYEWKIILPIILNYEGRPNSWLKNTVCFQSIGKIALINLLLFQVTNDKIWIFILLCLHFLHHMTRLNLIVPIRHLQYHIPVLLTKNFSPYPADSYLENIKFSFLTNHHQILNLWRHYGREIYMVQHTIIQT